MFSRVVDLSEEGGETVCFFLVGGVGGGGWSLGVNDFITAALCEYVQYMELSPVGLYL